MGALSRMAFEGYLVNGSAIEPWQQSMARLDDANMNDDNLRIGKESLGAFTACWRPFEQPSKMYNRTMTYSYCAFDDTIPIIYVSDRVSCMVQWSAHSPHRQRSAEGSAVGSSGSPALL